MPEKFSVKYQISIKIIMYLFFTDKKCQLSIHPQKEKHFCLPLFFLPNSFAKHIFKVT